jgi:hypothetical protein
MTIQALNPLVNAFQADRLSRTRAGSVPRRINRGSNSYRSSPESETAKWPRWDSRSDFNPASAWSVPRPVAATTSPTVALPLRERRAPRMSCRCSARAKVANVSSCPGWSAHSDVMVLRCRNGGPQRVSIVGRMNIDACDGRGEVLKLEVEGGWLLRATLSASGSSAPRLSLSWHVVTNPAWGYRPRGSASRYVRMIRTTPTDDHGATGAG